VAEAGLRVCVAAVAEEVDVDVGNAHLFGNFEKCVKVVDVGVLSGALEELVGNVEQNELTTPPSETRPRRCKRPLPSFARLNDLEMFSTLFSSFFLMVWSMRTTWGGHGLELIIPMEK